MEVRSLPVRGQKWRHFLGRVYTIQYIARCPDTKRLMVVYSDEDYVEGSRGVNEGVWVIPLETFMSRISRMIYPNAIKVYRFELEDKAIEKLELLKSQLKARKSYIIPERGDASDRISWEVQVNGETIYKIITNGHGKGKWDVYYNQTVDICDFRIPFNRQSAIKILREECNQYLEEHIRLLSN